MRTRWSFRFAACLVGAALLSSAAAPAQEDAEEKAPPKEGEADYYELMKTFADTFEQVERNYVKDVDRRRLLEAAIKGMMEELDPYSSFIAPEELTKFTEAVEQEFGGIGIQVQPDPKTRMLTVVSPLPGTPAYKAGVLAGDTIVEVEGKPAEGMTTEEAVKLLKGPPGVEVTIAVKHLGSEEIHHLKMTRELIHVATVMGDHYNDDGSWDFMVDRENKIGYVRLTHFSRRSADELLDALKALKSEGMRGLVLDLRFNPGGLLTQATEIADVFLDSGKIVSTKGRNTEEKVWEARKPGTWSGFPMAVLVNRYSASASEIVSAALQDHDRAVVVGERTWGKGSVQNVIELEGGSSALKLTTASYHRPSGKNIHRFPNAKDEDDWGVMPDDGFLVRQEDDELRRYLEYRRLRDVLKKGGPGESDFEDKQLAKALEVVLSKLKDGDKEPEKAAAGAETPESEDAAEEGREAAFLRVPRVTVL